VDDGRVAAMPTAREMVFTEMVRFRAALPVLLETLAGKWVVFKDGQVVSAHDDEDAAYWAGVQAFGTHGGQVVARVEPERPPQPLSAGMLFRPSSMSFVGT